jgi:uncharacterized protein YecA (UPF0149 family)
MDYRKIVQEFDDMMHVGYHKDIKQWLMNKFVQNELELREQIRVHLEREVIDVITETKNITVDDIVSRIREAL